MTTTACPSCGNTVSNKAYDCPGCGHPLRKLRRGPFGLLFKWLFILFNIVMLIWIFSYLSSVGELIEGTSSDAERAGAEIGATIGTGMLIGIWAVGDVVLGLFVLLTRPSK